MRWARHVVHTGREEVYTCFWWGNLREREDPGVDGVIILKWIFRKWHGRHGLNCSASGQGQVAGTSKRDSEPSGFAKCGEVLG